jgi:4,4'-diaponeurosporenoate glycosyltransferase
VREQASVFFNITAIMGSSAFTCLGDRVRVRVAFGPVLATSRADYERAGGHAHRRVRAAVAEDIALAANFDAVHVYLGCRSPSFRMYDGFASLVRGWTKNIATGASSIAWWCGLMVVAWIWSLAGGFVTSPYFYAASVVQVWVLGRRVGRFGPFTAIAYPLFLVVFLAVFVRSVALIALCRPVRWRGRSVATRS